MSNKIVERHKILAFYGVPGTNDAVTYHRMKKFTQFSHSKNPIEYSRQYVDEPFQQTDVVALRRHTLTLSISIQTCLSRPIWSISPTRKNWATMLYAPSSLWILPQLRAQQVLPLLPISVTTPLSPALRATISISTPTQATSRQGASSLR